MPSLGDYIGRLVAEAANARAQADMETARLAEMYRADPLLRYFTVPRFRLPAVKLSVPVAVVDLPEHGPPLTVEQAMTSVANMLRRELARRGAALTDAEWSAVTSRLGEAAHGLTADPRAQESDFYLADALGSAAVEALPERMREAPSSESPTPSTGGSLGAELLNAARLAVIGTRVPAPQLEVKVTAAELVGIDPNTILHVDLTLSEQGLEWSGADDAHSRLTPE